jgi:hypothetical protein
VLGEDQAAAATPKRSASPAEPAFATLTMKPWVPREDPTDDAANGPTLRQRISAAEPAPAEVPKRGFLGRLFGRFRRT